MSEKKSPGAEVLPASSEGSSSPQNVAPLVSVVIPAYRCAAYLRQAIESVLHQSYPNYETIVINDGSPDSSEIEATLEPYRERIRYLWQPNRGPSAARNRGIYEAGGKFIAFLDSDDYWAPDHLSKQLAMFEQNPQLELVYSDWVLVKDEKPWRRAFGMEPQSPEVTFDSLLLEHSNIGTSTVVVYRSTILRAGCFDEKLRRCEDFEMWLRIAFIGARMAYHPDAHVFHRCNDAGLSADDTLMSKARIHVYQKTGDTLPLTRAQRQMVKQCVASNQADLHILEMKRAIVHRRYKAALDSGSRAEAIRRRWKLKLSLLGLKIAPPIFRQLHLVRAWLLNRRSHQTELNAELWSDLGTHDGESGASPASQKPAPEARSTMMV